MTVSVTHLRGFALPNAILRLDLAGRNLTHLLKKSTRLREAILLHPAEREIVRDTWHQGETLLCRSSL